MVPLKDIVFVSRFQTPIQSFDDYHLPLLNEKTIFIKTIYEYWKEENTSRLRINFCLTVKYQALKYKYQSLT